MLKFYSIISGSSGNCSLITNGKTHILVDCGTSGKQAIAALEKLSVPANMINAIFVSHEHIDHTKGVGILARKLHMPIYATAGTHRKMNVGNICEEQVLTIVPDAEYLIDDVKITPFSIPHDAEEPCGFIFSDGSSRIATATDIGFMTRGIVSRLSGCDSVLLESNHDIDMLRFGEYPFALKQRILSKLGHLSNIDAARTALELVKNGTKNIMLGHLSDKNNMPEIALMETYNMLTDNGIDVGKDVTLKIAERYEITEM